MSDKIYIVWNAVRTEGFVTVDKHLAYEARKGSDTNCFDADGRRSDLAVKFCELTGDEDCITQVLDPACITPLSADELMLTLYVLNVYTENVGGVEKADDRGVYRRILALQQKVKMAVGQGTKPDASR